MSLRVARPQLFAVLALAFVLAPGFAAAAPVLQVGFADRDVTPKVGPNEPVWLAGYGPGRRAQSVHDPIFARAMVLADGDKKVAIVSLDVVGLQFDQTLEIRRRLEGIDYVLVCSTHNHEAPDVVGIWGPSFVQRGVDNRFLSLCVEKTVEAVREAEKRLQPAEAKFGQTSDETLVNDSRKPVIKDDAIKTLVFTSPDDGEPIGVLVKWSVHPEAMGSRNTALTADYPAATIETLNAKYRCPVVFVVGAIGGLLAPPKGGILDAKGEELKPGQFEFTWAYGRLVGKLAEKAIEKSRPVALTPIRIFQDQISLPVTNNYYRAARSIRVLQRNAHVWTGDIHEVGEPLAKAKAGELMAVRTEVALIRLGEFSIPCIPGELYPELLFGKFQEPVEPNADFPDAPREPHVAAMMPTKDWMLIGLANDEIGYIIPKRQWDQAAPFAYGRSTGQYGEINSCGPDIAKLLLDALQACIASGEPQSR